MRVPNADNPFWVSLSVVIIGAGLVVSWGDPLWMVIWALLGLYVAVATVWEIVHEIW